MNFTRRTVTPAGLAAATAPLRAGHGQAGHGQAGPAIKIGCLTDMSGPYKDLAEPGAAAAAHQAAAEFGSQGFNVEILVADHLNKPGFGAATAREWFDRDGAGLIVELADSGVALAVAGIAAEKNKVNAGVYSSSLHYLKVVAGMGAAQPKVDGAATVARMKAVPTDDDCFGPGFIRLAGRKIHPSYLWQVKAPAESEGAWDYYKPLASTPAENAFRPLDKGGCPLVKS